MLVRYGGIVKIEILNRWTNTIMKSGEYQSQKTAVEAEKADLHGADLRGADLYGADLRGADLYGADLHGADLRGADLSEADLPGADLHGADLSEADLRGADLRGADLRGADLSGADLSRANLHGADLNGADLNGADLSRANLHEADLRRANLHGTRGVNKYLVTPLLLLLDCPRDSKLCAYKLVNEYGEGPFSGGLRYEIDVPVSVSYADLNPEEQCGEGINVATLDWCIGEWKPGYKILLVQFCREDIACIPTGTDGKFRLFRCTPVAEKNLVELGLVKPEEES